jgi:hypothetical protein
MIDEADTDNWGIGGETVTILRSKPPAGEGPKKKELPEKLLQYMEQRKSAAAESGHGEEMVRTKLSRKGKKQTE